jgi:hypothetical protein
MRIVLVGAPGAGKKELAQSLSNTLDCSVYQTGFESDGETPVGMLADYRNELRMAIDRARAHLESENCIFVTSLLDSIAYSTYRTESLLRNEAPRELIQRWILVSDVITMLASDSFEYDLLFFVPLIPDEDTDEFALEFDNLWQEYFRNDVPQLKDMYEVDVARSERVEFCLERIKEKSAEIDARRDSGEFAATE